MIDYEIFCGTTSGGDGTDEIEAVPEISVAELKRRFDSSKPLVLLDVREPHEYEIARIEGARLIPLGELSGRLDEIEGLADELIVHCHSGSRSSYAVQLLQQAGFKNVYHLAGGIDAWSEQIDPSVPRY